MTFLPMVNYKEGAYVTIENAPCPSRFYLIAEGRAQVSKNHSSIQDRKNVILGPGDSIGAVACLSGRNEIETVQARSDLRVLVIERSRFDELVQENIQVAMKIIMQFATSIQMLNAAISQLSQLGKVKGKSESRDSAPRLYRVGEFYQANSRFNQAHYAYYRCVQNYPESSFSDQAQQEMEKIKPYVTQEKFDYPKEEFKRIYPKDAMLFVESESGKELFFILKGMVKVSRIENDKEIPLALLKEGDVCGKISMLIGSTHTTNAEVIEECHVLAVGPMGFETVMRSQSRLLFRLSSRLADQVWFLNKQILNRSLIDPLARLYDMLSVLLEKEHIFQDDHQFHFGMAELVGMAGYSHQASGEIIEKILSEGYVKLSEKGEIRVVNIADIFRKNESNWKKPIFHILD
jgi:CRP-like cAMP-binding protein